ncbi:MAG TPA: ACP S-malonyltransferase [Candidatus Aquicultor sp.]
MANKTGVAFVFPGQGSQYIGMGKDLVETYPQVRAAFDMATDMLDKGFLDLCVNGPESDLNDTLNTQVCIYIISYGIYAMLEESGIQPQVMAGHSLGEYSALTAAKTFKFDEGLRIVAKRAELMSEAAREHPGAMLAVLGADMRGVDDAVSQLSQQGMIAVANYNSPGQIVVSVDKDLVDNATVALLQTGAKKVVPLPVSGAFHSPAMKPAQEQFNGFLESFIFMTADVPVVPNTLAKPAVDPAQLKEALERQMASAVKWQQSVEQMIGLGITTFVEVGPGQVLSKIIKRIDRQISVLPTETPEFLEKVLSELVA